jgi:nitroreductase
VEELEIANLFARRSIRKFTDQEISSEQIEMLLKAAMAAPSAGNRRPWQFVAVTDPERLAAMAESHPHAKMLREAPLCIVPCAEPGRSYPEVADYWVQDLSAATENVLLAAVGLGLGAVWCGVHPREERVAAARRILGIPDSIVPFAYIAVGYPGETKEPRTQYDPGCVHVNHW